MMVNGRHSLHIHTVTSYLDFQRIWMEPLVIYIYRLENHIVSRILAARSDDGIVGEEGSCIVSKSGLTWVIDPLDGTTNYFYGLAASNQ